MRKSSSGSQRLSIFMQYLCKNNAEGDKKIPSLIELSQELGVSVASLREQMEVARTLGFIDVKPRTGIQRSPYSFSKTIITSLTYAMEKDPANFGSFSDLRKHIEAAYWKEAVSLLAPEDIEGLKQIVDIAKAKLKSKPPQIPHEEHKIFHLSIYRKLNNPFVIGILESYWKAYEDNGLDIYTDIQYLEQVWSYHQKSVEAISSGELDSGFRSFAEHMELISKRSNSAKISRFE